jgi:hypothetical protein
MMFLLGTCHDQPDFHHQSFTSGYFEVFRNAVHMYVLCLGGVGAVNGGLPTRNGSGAGEAEFKCGNSA